jgi:hypothetical protein
VRIANAIRIASLLWLVAHFGLTIAYLMPLNPLKVAMQPLLDATIGVYFEQNWSLFAPSPRSSEQALLARPLSNADVQAIPTHGLPTDGWYDLSTPLQIGFEHNHFSAYERLTRPQYRAVVSYLLGDPALVPWQQSCQKGDPGSCAVYTSRLRIARSQAAAMLARMGSAFYKDVARPDDTINYVALRMREIRRVPWDERHTAQRVTQDVELGIYPLDELSVAVGLYRPVSPE